MKNKRKIIDKWIKNNGGADFDLKGKNIILYDNALFAIETEKIKTHKVIGFKPLSDGSQEVLFSKRKYNDVEHKAYLWFGELRETINYLRRMERMLNKLGYKTDTVRIH